MAENSLLDEFVRAWKEGWKRGAALPQPAGPSVGRGFFSNWCLTERQREINELRALSAEVYQAFKASPYGSEDGLHKTLTMLFRDFSERADIELPDALIDAFVPPLYDLVQEEFFSVPRAEMHRIARLSMERRTELRRDLRRKQQFLEDADHRFDTGMDAIAQLMAAYLDAVPEWPEPSTTTTELALQTRLVDLMERPARLIEATIGTLFDRALTDDDLFKTVRGSLEWNALTASGIEPINRNSSKPIVLPTNFKSEDPDELIEAYLARTPFEDIFRAPLPLAITDDLRFEHTHIVGGTGHGKSQLLLQLIHHDLTREDQEPPGLVVIDSQGDLIQTLVRLELFSPGVPGSLADRLIFIDPNDVEFPPALNLFAVNEDRLAQYGPAERERIINGVVDLYEYFFASLLGAELTQKQGVVFRYIARLMLEIPGATIQTLRALMEDGRPFRDHMAKLDGSARWFFETEFFSKSFEQTRKQILRRLWGVLANPVFERMFSNPENKIDLFQALANGKIVLINTAKDLLKPEGCSIFGRFFIAQLAQAVTERASVPEGERWPAFIYIDEAQDYFDETIDLLLNQARKYRVGLTLAHQNLDQLTPRLRSSILASTSVKFAGGVSSKDARALSDDFHATPDFLTGVRKRQGATEFAAYLKNRTERALRVSVPLGRVNAAPRMDEAEFDELVGMNRDRVATPISEVQVIIAKMFDRSGFSQPGEPNTPTRSVAGTTTDRSRNTPPVSLSEPSISSPQDVQMVEDPYLEGQGGREHKYLQHLIRGLGQDRGFKATIEKPVGDGRSIDVALEQDEVFVGFEISITTPSDHEIQNLRKCFDAGASQAALIVHNSKRKRALTEKIEHADLPHAVDVLSADEVPEFIDRLAAKISSETKISRGYRVTVHHSAASPRDAEYRRKTLTSIIARSLLHPNSR